MSWMAKLYETYEAGMQLDLSEADRPMPISHTLQNAHIKITIDGEGNFKRAEVLEKTQIVLPATEKSASRSSGEEPHPLTDKIQYVAKDYPEYGGKKKAYFSGYLEQLKNWCVSPQAHTKVCAVKKYVERGVVVRDLIRSNILYVDDDNNLLVTWPNGREADTPLIFKVLPKEKGQLDQGNALVCWNVEIVGDLSSETWKDSTVQDSWLAYDSATREQTELCYITGKQQPLATNHPAKLRHTGDKAKLVSSNDTSGYTFRGRFTDSGAQSVGIAYEVTQKAHNALRWLITRQGYRNNDQVVVAWAVSGTEIPQPMEDTFSLLSGEIQETPAPLFPIDNQVDHAIDLGQSFATALNKYMAGYRAKLKVTDNIVIMGLDSATPGRMAVTYYQEFFPEEYIKQISQWHTDFSWYQRHKIEVDIEIGKTKPASRTVWPVCTPSPRAIWEAIYGSTVSDSLKKNTIERILPSIVEARPFPQDLVKKTIRRVSNRSGYKSDEQWLWEKHLGIACALYRGFSKRNPNKTKEYEMALEENNHSRDYLYGRLLAIAEQIEEMAMFVAKEKARSTQASRLMQRFSDHPFSTWKTIEEGINPYQQRLRNNIAPLENAYKQLLDNVCDKFESDDFIKAEKLSGEYLLGYHLQRKWLRDHKLKAGQWISKDINDHDELQTEGE